MDMCDSESRGMRRMRSRTERGDGSARALQIADVTFVVQHRKLKTEFCERMQFRESLFEVSWPGSSH